jgi:predicted DNA-binding transcriptional regulator AlpA
MSSPASLMEVSDFECASHIFPAGTTRRPGRRQASELLVATRLAAPRSMRAAPAGLGRRIGALVVGSDRRMDSSRLPTLPRPSIRGRSAGRRRVTTNDQRPWRDNAKAVEGETLYSDPTTPRLAFRADEVAASLGISKRTIQRLLSAGKFPRPNAYAGKCPLWTRATLEKWLAGGGGQL